MTYLEKLRLEHPTMFDPNKHIDIYGQFCPHDFGYMLREGRDCTIMCEECWNREIPEEKKVKTCLDQIKEDDPEYVDDRYWGGANGYPHHYFVGAVQKCKNKNVNSGNLVCTACWNQPLPEENIEPPKKKEYEAPSMEIDSRGFKKFGEPFVEGMIAGCSGHSCDKSEVKTDTALSFAMLGSSSAKATTSMEELVENIKNSPVILDSGNRREFETGAVRDIQEGKGRCDLMPLDVVGDWASYSYELSVSECFVFDEIEVFKNTGLTSHLFNAINRASLFNNPFSMFLEVAKHFEEGAKKYGENNWQKGIPVRCYVDSAVRHYLKFLRGDKDEPHDRAFCWNIMCAIWTCKHKPELNDYAKKEET